MRATSYEKLWVGGGYVAAYVLLDALSFVQPLLKLGITPWNPQAGLTLAFLLVRGWRCAPWTAAAALLAELFVRGSPAPIPVLALASLAPALAYGAVARWLVERGGLSTLRTRRDALYLSGGAGVAALASAVGYTSAFMVAGVLPQEILGAALARYWVGDLNGVLTLTPLLIYLQRAPELAVQIRGRGALIVGQAVFLCATLWLVFGPTVAGDIRFVYALFAPVAWIALTWGVPGTTLATLLIQIGLMFGSEHWLATSSVIEIQFLLVTLGLTALLLGAVVAERSLALERVAAAEAEQRALLTTAPDAVLIAAPDQRIVSANLAARRLFGLADPDADDVKLSTLLPALDVSTNTGRKRTTGVLMGTVRFPVEVAWTRLDPPARHGFLFMVRDITDQEAAQAQLRERDTALARAMRLALAGELATALTHELNQPMTALVSYLRAVEILAAPLETRDPRLIETLRKAMREALRASDVLKRLRDFYRSGATDVAELDLAALVAEVVQAFHDRATRMGAQIDFSASSQVPALGDRIQVQMVLHNLIGNALDALAEVEPGARAVRIKAWPTDRGTCISVEDSGPGVSADVEKELFDPFVTTKPDGMGLGLAISRSLMRGQGGDLRLDREGAPGARFVIQLSSSAKV
ncbi:MAG: MASE1 domain-containing protein [Steroidobacteraceae bacterium]|nr:MASE1 domain-containing protein [Steroidobacteraceae bacterium]